MRASARPRVLNTEPSGYSDEARAIVADVAEVVELDLDRAGLLRHIGEFDGVIVRLRNQIDPEVLEHAGRLRVIVSATTGLDHIDLDAAAARGIEVLSLRGQTAFLRTISSTAEHTWALLLALTRRVVEAVSMVRAGQWDRDAVRARDLRGRRLGIVGLGRIGTQVAEYGAAFGMSVAAFDSRPVSHPGVTLHRTLDDLLIVSDVLSIHVPLAPDTVDLIGARELRRLPPGALVVNTSRGEVIDEDALADSLEAGHLAGAALDVVRSERDGARRAGSRLLAYAHPNLLITPHSGGASHEAMARTEVFMARQLAAFFSVTEGRN